ncbi:phage baseplate protein [Lentilactobacillus diolivorans]|uniref:Mn2+ Fe2+ transporter n=2 Tax=Lentilactobacillus diolivorans TaxID=179838 RepID=A0A0R1SEJ0_9LACO|nr:hypothetical protein [Lentilactobacillus diolivorans]KRL67113.1 Mn2+ Fe2+ transporter [Lentilactobacillus diolivorans DSM 14421]GEP24162.1 hypothetical protein LDI01_17550 [Lentilactobacillus diolivorans]
MMVAKTTYLNTKQLKSAIKSNSLRAQHEGNRSYLIGVQTKVLQAKYDKASGSDKATLGRMIETYKGSQKAHIAAHKKYAAKVKAEKATLAKRSTAAKVQANKNKIAGKIANNKPKFNTGHMMLYRTDGHSSAIVFMSSVPESEDNTVQVTPNALPKGEPTATHSQQTEKDISITARIMGTDAQQRTAFNQLLKWKAEGCEMTYKGRIYYKHCLFTALHREYNKDETALTITFGLQFIDWSELKTSGKSASSGTKSKTHNKSTAKKYVTTKLGTTYASLADDYNTTIAKLISMDSYKSAVNILPYGVKIRVS